MFQFKIFKNKNIIQGISDASFGSMRKKKRIIKFLLALNKKKLKLKNFVWAEQVFGKKVHLCQKADNGQTIKKVDGLLTNLAGQILAIISADCVPILLFDPPKQIVGILHGSRVSLMKGIINQALQQMKSNFGSRPADLLVGIGPHIRKCHYWLPQQSVPARFKKYLIQSTNRRTSFDLTSLVFAELKKAGIKNKNIEDCRICTFCQYQKYFSARKQKEKPKIYPERNSRFVSVIGLQQRILKINNQDQSFLLKEAVNLLKQGGVLVFPTDTVYGLLADAIQQAAVVKIFKIKKRPLNKPLPIFVRDLKMAKKLAQINQKQEEFLKQVWPGKVTVVLKRKKGIKIYGVEPKTIALRIPRYSLINCLLKKLKHPLIGTSANLSGQPATTRLRDVLGQFKNQPIQPDLFIEANLKPGRPSLVFDLTTEEIKILRK
ncbi:MAG: L-threonylcarbamoyladenylate synthase [Minisyncoccales bacterium]